MKKTALVIMAAGMGTRFGKGIKQLAPVGPNGEIIMDYSIRDALEAGFNKVVFIIRKDIEDEFRKVIGERIEKITGPNGEIIMDYSIRDALEAGFNKVVFIIRKDIEDEFRKVIGERIEKITEVAYAFQDMEDIPEGFSVPDGRTKPWGTGHAVLAAKKVLDEPFAVINADDYYGKEAYVKVHDYLVSNQPEDGKLHICMAGFRLGNTLSDNGSVTRGICHIENGQVTEVAETHNIYKTETGADVRKEDGTSQVLDIKSGSVTRGICHIENGQVTEVAETHNIYKTETGADVRKEDGTSQVLDIKSIVSMNMWGLPPAVMESLETGFSEFLAGIEPGDIKKEYLLPELVDRLIHSGKVLVDVLETKDEWFGVTYQGIEPGDIKKEYLLPELVDRLIHSGKALVDVLETKDEWFGVTYQEDKETVMAAFRALTEAGVYPNGLYD